MLFTGFTDSNHDMQMRSPRGQRSQVRSQVLHFNTKEAFLGIIFNILHYDLSISIIFNIFCHLKKHISFSFSKIPHLDSFKDTCDLPARLCQPHLHIGYLLHFVHSKLKSTGLFFQVLINIFQHVIHRWKGKDLENNAL